jgi:MFS family permease
MNIIKNSRLRVPVLAIILGSGSTAAVVASGGWNWANLIPLEVVVVGGAIGYYVWGGRDSDVGAMLGSRIDERQNLLRTRAQAFAAVVMAFAAVVGTMVATALRDPTWPFVLFAGIGVASFVAGLAIFRDGGPRNSVPPALSHRCRHSRTPPALAG